MPEDQTDELLTTQEVAATFRVHVTTVGRWVRKGQIPAIRTPAGIYRIRYSDVAAFLGLDGDQDQAS